MAKILVHALAATAGGGKTYLFNFLDRMAKTGEHHRWLVLPPPGPVDGFPRSEHISYLDSPGVGSSWRRVLYDQVGLARIVREQGVDLILATGNFGMVRPPVPQILLSRNALYFSRDHVRELRRRFDVKQLLTTVMRRKFAIASIRASKMNIVPTAAFGDEICQWLGNTPPDFMRAIPHGFDHAGFRQPIDPDVRSELLRKLNRRPGARRVLLVSRYNYFRNFDTLIRAMAELRQTSWPPVELVLTTKIAPGLCDHRYDTTASARLIDKLGIQDSITMLGAVPHRQLPTLYDLVDVVVCPSYAETFGHPMVEAMARARPIVASDRGVHREICQDAALYFSPFDAEQLAYRISQILDDPGLATQLGTAGLRRAADFSWDKHFQSILQVIDEVLQGDRKHAVAA